MGIRDELAAHDARFISVSDLIKNIADEEGVTSAEVARLLILNGALNHLQTRLKLHGHGGYSEGGDAAANFELQNAICDGKAWLDDCAQNEFREGEPGFFRDEVAEALKVAGWRVPSTLAGQIADVSKLPPTPRERPDLLPFVPRVNITLAEAADILREANGGKWWAALEDAVDSDQIKAGTWGAYRGDQPLSHADLRAWCEAGGIAWPVPLPPAPTTLEKLVQAAHENGRSVIELEILRQELEVVTKERDELLAARESATERVPPLAADMKARLLAEKDAELVKERMRSAELAAEVERLRSMADEAGKGATKLPQINSPTLRRIFEAVEQFPAWRDTQNQEPIMKTVLAWQEGRQEKTGGNSRLAYVAHRVIAEHFDLKK